LTLLASCLVVAFTLAESSLLQKKLLYFITKKKVNLWLWTFNFAERGLWSEHSYITENYVFISGRRVNCAADIYSFGIVALEVSKL